MYVKTVYTRGAFAQIQKRIITLLNNGHAGETRNLVAELNGVEKVPSGFKIKVKKK